MFITYYLVRGDKIHMGNRQTCRVVDVGHVRINMYNGCKRILTGIRHVPRRRE